MVVWGDKLIGHAVVLEFLLVSSDILLSKIWYTSTIPWVFICKRVAVRTLIIFPCDLSFVGPTHFELPSIFWMVI
jgi:hypothetical protein